MKKEVISSEKIHRLIHGKRTFGQKAADILAQYAGSWGFIFGFTLFLIIWMLINGYFLLMYQYKPFDPYPFILLNLVLSCLAAIQAPIILMSQNRQAEKDRKKAEYDYLVNRRAEKEIEQLKKQLNRIERKIGSSLH